VAAFLMIELLGVGIELEHPSPCCPKKRLHFHEKKLVQNSSKTFLIIIKYNVSVVTGILN